MDTLLWTYLGWRRFPRELTLFEIRRFFALSAKDRRELRVRYPVRLRLGAAIQLGFVRMTATTLDALDYVPGAVLEHVARQLALPAPELATLRALYRNERTLFAHQAWTSRCRTFVARSTKFSSVASQFTRYSGRSAPRRCRRSAGGGPRN